MSSLASGLRNVHISDNSNGSDVSRPQEAGDQQYKKELEPQGRRLTSSPSQLKRLQTQYEQETKQKLDSDSVTRLKDFFANGPRDEGFTLISHRSAPNGFKVAVVLSELGYSYQTILLDFSKGDQKSPEFLAINPNGRVPALIDHTNLERQITIWESGAIILYLVEKKYKETGVCPSIWSKDLVEQSQMMSWLFFQTSGHSPMIGQALHFKYFHAVNVPSAIERYTDEVRRVYGVVEMALSEKREAFIMELDAENAESYSAGLTPMSESRYFDSPVWLVGEKVSIADLCFVTWNYVVDRIGIDLKTEYPEVYKWTKHMMRRPAVVRALKGGPVTE
ncbi:DEKNAAC100543 [Brettanomyces naardenensis]|uniref:Protein URE2 n=1 Tax=Brettanomyces naardenensis TaxID=13370 RepID=A0A448YEJ9_BRENA|nr:DEKNAAC100543 [Brettanomyces naardenensis]